MITLSRGDAPSLITDLLLKSSPLHPRSVGFTPATPFSYSLAQESLFRADRSVEVNVEPVLGERTEHSQRPIAPHPDFL